MKTKKEVKFDYIIAGSGCAGLSLLYRMLNNPELSGKKILVLDKNEKTENDRTWCYWEKEDGLFDSIVHHKWNTLEFLTNDFSKTLDLGSYDYKMIRGSDFYSLILSFAKNFKNVTFKLEEIKQIKSEGGYAHIETDKNHYFSEYVFNSTQLFFPKMDSKNTLLQHFEGWVIKSEKPLFNNKIGTLMDFRVHQNNGDTFMYVLPTTPNEALLEYTLFSEKLLDKEAYKSAIQYYITNNLKIEKYEILHKESGVIPMTLAKFPRNKNPKDRVICIGTAGGFTKASSGYTFHFIQKSTKQIIKNLSNGNSPHLKITLREKMFQWYDQTVLEVMISKKLSGKKIFSVLFKKVPTERIIAFLSNESTFIEDLKIMILLPTRLFLTAGIKRFFMN